MTQLSAHFTLAELTISESAARLGIDNTPPADVMENLRRLVIVLEEVRTLLARPLIIISGYRSPALNKAIGGSQNSAHQFGLAADFIVPPLTPLQAAREIGKSFITFDQLIHEHSWIHLGLGPPAATMRRQMLTLTKAGCYVDGLREQT